MKTIVYFYIFIGVIALGIVLASLELYGDRDIKYNEVLVNKEK